MKMRDNNFSVFLANLPWELEKDEYAVRAGSRWAHKRNKRKDLYYYPFPFYLAYATAVLEKDGYNVFLRDYLTSELVSGDLFKDLRGKNPDLFVAEIATPSFDNDIKIFKKVKEEIGCRIVLCGPHATVYTKKTIEESPFVDYVMFGEYEYTLRELAESISANKPLKGVKGLAYRENGKVIVNEKRPLIQNLDELPFPSRHFLPINRYNDSFARGYPNIQMISSRGCPYKCSFCLEPEVFYGTHMFRYRSAKNVVDEMEQIIKAYNPEEIYFDDAIFTVGRERVKQICQEIKNRDLRVNWSVMGDTINPDESIIKAMAEAGCVGMKFGVESANEHILKNIMKFISLEKTKEVVKWCKKYGLRTHATYMFGLPGETKETIKKTIDYAIKLNTNSAQFSIATPYPGTAFYDQAKREGWIAKEDWTQFDGNTSYVINHPTLTQEELYNALIYARSRYYRRLAMRPSEVYYFLKKTYNLEGPVQMTKSLFNKAKWFFFEHYTLQKI